MARTVVKGTSGADRMQDGRGGPFAFLAGNGNDQILLLRDDDLGGDHFVDAGRGNDKVVSRFEGGNDIRLGAGNDLYASDGFSSLGGFDIVRAGDGKDTIAVSTLKSVYFGDAGNDTFFSAGWQNSFDGGSGVDTISYEFRHEDTTIGRTGVGINLATGVVQTGTSRTEQILRFENATGSIHADVIIGNGGANLLRGLAGDDGMAGGSGNDTLRGGNGNDLLFGQDGKDRLEGQNGRDELDGGAGRDILRGGNGGDVLTGGRHADTFEYRALSESRGAASDFITDFSRAEGDRIDLSRIDADTTRSGNQTFDFIGTNAFSGEAGELRLTGGSIVVDVDGDRAGDFRIDLDGATALRAPDFLL